jgi:hypothetical protein
MDKVSIWTAAALDHGGPAADSDGLEAIRGLLIGLAISQVFWTVVIWLVW